MKLVIFHFSFFEFDFCFQFDPEFKRMEKQQWRVVMVKWLPSALGDSKVHSSNLAVNKDYFKMIVGSNLAEGHSLSLSLLTVHQARLQAGQSLQPAGPGAAGDIKQRNSRSYRNANLD